MNDHQAYALHHHCRLAGETAHPRFGYFLHGGQLSVLLTVNSGYE